MKTQMQWTEQTATAFATIFWTNVPFVQGRIDLLTNGNLTICMNAADIDSFIKTDKKISDIGDYISIKINSKAKTENIIKNNISINLNGFWVKDSTLNNTKIVKK